MTSQRLGTAAWLALPLVAVGMALGSRLVGGPDEASVSATTFVAKAPPEAPPTRGRLGVAARSAVLGEVAPDRRAGDARAAMEARTRDSLVGSAYQPATGTKRKAMKGRYDLLEIGNSDYGVEAAYAVHERLGAMTDLVKDSAQVASKLWCEIDLFGKDFKILEFYARAHKNSGPLLTAKTAESYLDLMGKDLVTGLPALQRVWSINTFGPGGSGNWITIYSAEADFSIIGIPVVVGTRVKFMDVGSWTLSAGTTNAGSVGYWRPMVSGGAYVMVGALGCGVGIEALVDFFCAKPVWQLAASYTDLPMPPADSTRMHLSAISLRVQLFAGCGPFKETKTIASSGTLFDLWWPLGLKYYDGW